MAGHDRQPQTQHLTPSRPHGRNGDSKSLRNG
jgi:hypothetical protein